MRQAVYRVAHPNHAPAAEHGDCGRLLQQTRMLLAREPGDAERVVALAHDREGQLVGPVADQSFVLAM